MSGDRSTSLARRLGLWSTTLSGVGIILGAGIEKEHMRIISPTPKNHDSNVEILREELAHDGPSVIVARRTCLEAIKRA